MPQMPDLSALSALRDEVAGCTRCALADGRTTTVFGAGDPEAALMLVGEGPGREEDLRGEPFVGRSGRLLDTLLSQEIGFDRAKCYIANTVKCLSGASPVQLADGSWAPIERLVHTRYAGRVRSVDAAGRLVTARVVGWHASPLAGRRVLRLAREPGAAPPEGGLAETRLTADHEVLTEHGWTPAGHLRTGDRVATGHAVSSLVRDLVAGAVLGDPAADVHRVAPAFAGTASVVAALRRELGSAVRSTRPGAMAAAGTAGAMAAAADVSTGAVDVDVAAVPAIGIIARGARPGSAGASGVPSWVEGPLTPRVVAAWFLGSGRLHVRPGRSWAAAIAVRGAREDALASVRRGLLDLGVETDAAPGEVRLGAVATRRLAVVIAPYVPPPARGLLPAGVARTVPFDPALLMDSEPEVLYDHAVVDEVGAGDPGETFFCLDVEDTHCFVSGGGVVHNCRPPGNRDPSGAELDACRGYLDRQLALVDPRVVVTLGNVAMRALLGTTKGIRSMRGTTHPFGRAWLVPTYHPAAALRSGGEVLAEMRADLVRAKRLLASGTRPTS